MTKSIIKQKSTMVISDLYKIDHQFGNGRTLKIIEIDENSNETVLIEIQAIIGRFVRLEAEITDNKIL